MGQHFRFIKPMWATQTSGSHIYCLHVLQDARKLSLILCRAKRGEGSRMMEFLRGGMPPVARKRCFSQGLIQHLMQAPCQFKLSLEHLS